MGKEQQESIRRQRRNVDQMIADLQTKILSLREREAKKQAMADPALRHAARALKSLERALEEVEDAGTKTRLLEARSKLSGCLDSARAGDGASRAPRARPAADPILPGVLLAYVQENPGRRGEEIAAALVTDAGTIRPVMKRLIAEGKVTTEGERRGTTYLAT